MSEYVVKAVRTWNGGAELCYVTDLDDDDVLAPEQHRAARMTRQEAENEAKEWDGARIVRLVPGPKKATQQALLAAGRAWLATACNWEGRERDGLVEALRKWVEVRS